MNEVAENFANNLHISAKSNPVQNNGIDKEKQSSNKKKIKKADKCPSERSEMQNGGPPENGDRTTVIYERETQKSTEKKKKKKKSKQNPQNQKENTTNESSNQFKPSNTVSNHSQQISDASNVAHKYPRKKNRKRLERCYGHFHCRKCDEIWTSAWTWRFQETYVVRYKQQCKKCRDWRFPFKTEYLKCPICGLHVPECECTEYDYEEAEIEKPPHRADLCEKCRTSTPCLAGRR